MVKLVKKYLCIWNYFPSHQERDMVVNRASKPDKLGYLLLYLQLFLLFIYCYWILLLEDAKMVLIETIFHC